MNSDRPSKNLTYVVAGPQRRRHRTPGTAPSSLSPRLVSEDFLKGSRKIVNFRKEVWKYYREHGRHDLPWRKTADPYRIMVSEMMLQQTQVPRVIEKYKEFLKEFSTVRALAKAPLSNVLRVWSGLGYNRRGKYLQDAAKAIVAAHKGRVPNGKEELLALPGMGPYTSSAVRAFAFDLPDILIETNVRAVFIHHFKELCKPGLHNEDIKVSDDQIIPLAHEAAAGQDPRKWHWALMDYGVHIKKLYKNPARKSRHYVRQSKFEGSLRQVRGEILRHLHTGTKTEKRLYSLIARIGE
jgi:A/G-specific adenine glycosylase